MSSTREVARFEVLRQVRSAALLAGIVVFAALAFAAVSSDVVQLGGATSGVRRDTPFVLANVLLVTSALGVLVLATVATDAALRDRVAGTGELLFATPLTPTRYLVGRLSGVLCVGLVSQCLVALAATAGAYAPWTTAGTAAASVASLMLTAAVSVVPTVLICGTLLYAVAVLTRSALATYVVVLALLVAYGAATIMTLSFEHQQVAALLDPFGIATAQTATRYWTPAERNARVLPFTGVVLANRLLWASVALVALGVAWRRFAVEWFLAPDARRARRARQPGRSASAAVAEAPVRRAPVAGGHVAAMANAFGTHVRTEVRAVVRGVPFWAMLVLAIANVVVGALFTDQLFGTPVHPRTYLMVDVIGSGFELYALALLTFYAGDLVWRERTAGVADVFDALPVPDWVLWGAKLLALALIAAGVLAAGVIAAVGFQLARGFTDIEPAVYLVGLAPVAARLVLVAVLALAAQALLRHRLLGYLAMAVFVMSGPGLDALGVDHRLLRYASTPPAPYSDMNGYAPFATGVRWFLLHWSAAACVLLALTHAAWLRGHGAPLMRQLCAAWARRGRGWRWSLTGAAAVYVASGGVILLNTDVRNERRSEADVERARADYERTYAAFDTMPSLRLVAATTAVDIRPEDGAVDVTGTYRLRNTGVRNVEQILLTVPDARTVTTRLALTAGVSESPATLRGARVLHLSSPVAPGAELPLTFRVEVRRHGFVDGRPDTRVVRNGTFFSSADYLPQVGYQRRRELDDPDARRRQGLVAPPLPRPDSMRLLRNYATPAADWISLHTVVSTVAGQIALAPGDLVRTWQHGARRYFEYTARTPVLGQWAYLSGAWATARDSVGRIGIAVHFHPAHTYNVARMLHAAKRSLAYYAQWFGPYQHRDLRIAEFPRYARFAQSYPGLVPFSESVGFIARLSDSSDVDYVSYVTAHEVAHQWWGHQVIGADLPGATLLSETLAQYAALMVMERERGADAMPRFLAHSLDNYLAGRGEARAAEVPLAAVGDQPHVHYWKGGLAMYALRQHIGEESVNRALARFAARARYRTRPYPTAGELLDALRAEVPPDRMTLFDDLFHRVTFWDLRARDALAVARDAGEYVVRLPLTSGKTYVDTAGVERDARLDEWVDVVVRGTRPDSRGETVLARQRHHVTARDTVLEIRVRGWPTTVVVDPWHVLLDRVPADNVADVRVATPPTKSGSGTVRLQDAGRARAFGRASAGAVLPSPIERVPNGDGFHDAIVEHPIE